MFSNTIAEYRYRDMKKGLISTATSCTLCEHNLPVDTGCSGRSPLVFSFYITVNQQMS